LKILYFDKGILRNLSKFINIYILKEIKICKGVSKIDLEGAVLHWSGPGRNAITSIYCGKA